ncbi:helix-turn-helix transcriptional regulator [Nocardioides bruguierae]|uniref:Helix-turn-helix domain-containing protein n=1 Tax=Nocardioides bruguierae TaxID=2945102 RepID=A0A9X2DE86_9ACTN|nr:helix-turn-helix domain-containing protein [Nocardioides bruguierae]MCM0622799.1 helix-turn-helix domain-containing protein [Nocardioides bruguierae]
MTAPQHQHPQTAPTLDAEDPLLSPEQVSEILGGIPVGSLKKWRTERQGPACLHIGRHVRYRRSAVEAWLHQKDDEGIVWMES